MMNSVAAESPDITVLIEQLRNELVDGTIELPLLPSVAAEVLSSSLDEQSDAARLAELIQQDQSLAAHVIRVVNSPAYRGATEVVALQQAIARLGMERIREIALTASLKSAVFKQASYQTFADEAWQVALAAGLWAKEFARASRRNVEIAYLGGLLHNVGAPLLLSRLGETATGLDRASVEQLLEALTAQAGAQLAQQWKLPAAVAVTIEHLYAFEHAGKDQDLVAVAHCGVTAAQWMCRQGPLTCEALQLPATEHLNLYPEDVEAIIEHEEMIRASMGAMS